MASQPEKEPQPPPENRSIPHESASEDFDTSLHPSADDETAGTLHMHKLSSQKAGCAKETLCRSDLAERCTTTVVDCSDPESPDHQACQHQPECANENDIGGLLDDPSKFPEGGPLAYRVVLGSFLGLTGVLLFTNSAGVIENHISEMLPDTPLSTIGWIFSINNFLSFGMTLISGPIFDHIGCKIPIVVGTLLMTVGYMCMSVSTKTYQFVLSYGVVGGLGVALSFGPLVAVLTHYFLRRRAMAIGFAYLGGAIGGIVGPIMFRSLIPKLGFGWAVRVATFLCLALLLLGGLLVTDRHVEFQKDNPDSQRAIMVQVVRSIDFKIFSNITFTFLVLGFLGNGVPFLVTTTFLPSYATAFNFSSSKAYMLSVVFNIFSIPGRVIPSFLADKYGRFNLICCISSLSTLAFFVIWLNRPVAHTLPGLFVFAGWFGFSSGSILSLAPAAIGQVFVVADIGKGIGTAFFMLSFGDLFGIPIAGAITNSRTEESFDHLVLFLALICICGTTASFVARYLYGGLRWVKV